MVRRVRGAALTGADRLVLYVLVGLGVALLFVPGESGESGEVVVEGAGGFRAVVPLAEERTLEVPGPLGTTVVEVSGGAARVASSPCPEKLCVRAGDVAEAGDVAVCVPNRVVVRAEGHERGEPDATSR
ncbi:MAG: hypothetical protein GF400_06655 [Candidatus Eisenbacteria bacterium]|nr:hypothetical protein [Candidatus Eisenbacteria bacterium]